MPRLKKTAVEKLEIPKNYPFSRHLSARFYARALRRAQRAAGRIERAQMIKVYPPCGRFGVCAQTVGAGVHEPFCLRRQENKMWNHAQRRAAVQRRNRRRGWR